MKYCKTCHVHYDSPLEHCMLCNGELESVGEITSESMYKFKTIGKKSSSRFFLRLFFFMNFASAVVALYLDFTDGLPLDWSLLVTIGNLYVIMMFLTLEVQTTWTSKLIRILIISVIATILIGLVLKDYSWAIDYVFPLAIMANVFLISLLIVVNKKRWFDYFASLIIITLIGLIPGLINLLHLTTVSWPSFICFSYSTFTLLGIIFLPSKSSREEFKRRFHV